jgi:hypothetical protein
MTPLLAVLLGLGLFAVIAGALFLVGRASKEVARELAQELERAGEHAIVGPEPALYSGASARYTKVRGNCVLALTERRLLIRMLVGSNIDLDRSEIVGAHDAKTFDGHFQGKRYLVVDLKDATEIGFLVRDMAPWKAALGESNTRT